MPYRDAPRRIREQLSIQQIGTETLIYDERRHLAFCLNQCSSVIWRLADGEHSIAQISRAASLQLKTAVSEELVLFALNELRNDALLEPAPTPELVQPISRRAMLQRLGAGGALLLPTISAIVAPTAAQAYSGCVDCSNSLRARARRRPPTAAPSQ